LADIYKKMKKARGFLTIIIFFILIILILILVKVSYGINCDYDSEPYLTDEIDVTCNLDVDEDFNCMSYVKQDSELKYVYPITKDLEEVGRIDYFTSKGRVLKVYYKGIDLYPDTEYVFGVKCASLESDTIEVFNATIIPKYYDPREMTYRGEFIKENFGWYLVLAIFLVVVVGGAYWIYKTKVGW